MGVLVFVRLTYDHSPARRLCAPTARRAASRGARRLGRRASKRRRVRYSGELGRSSFAESNYCFGPPLAFSLLALPASPASAEDFEAGLPCDESLDAFVRLVRRSGMRRSLKPAATA